MTGFLSAMYTDIGISGKKKCDCLTGAVQKREAKLFPLPSITSSETAHYLKIFWGQKLHHSGKIEILTSNSMKVAFTVLEKSEVIGLKTYSPYNSKCYLL